TAYDETAADYTTTSLTVGPHIMTYLRPSLAARGVHTTADLPRGRDGSAVRVAGHVIVRQRPGTAKGMCFLTLEDETGTANAFLTPPLFERWRVLLNTSALVEVQGLLEHREGVTHVRALRLRRLQAPERMAVGDHHGGGRRRRGRGVVKRSRRRAAPGRRSCSTRSRCSSPRPCSRASGRRRRGRSSGWCPWRLLYHAGAVACIHDDRGRSGAAVTVDPGRRPVRVGPRQPGASGLQVEERPAAAVHRERHRVVDVR